MSVELLGKSLSDLSIVTMIFRIILSMACGGVIGLERGKANQPAGMRTRKARSNCWQILMSVPLH